jgi:hypothetical protein
VQKLQNSVASRLDFQRRGINILIMIEDSSLPLSQLGFTAFALEANTLLSTPFLAAKLWTVWP